MALPLLGTFLFLGYEKIKDAQHKLEGKYAEPFLTGISAQRWRSQFPSNYFVLSFVFYTRILRTSGVFPFLIFIHTSKDLEN